MTQDNKTEILITDNEAPPEFPPRPPYLLKTTRAIQHDEFRQEILTSGFFDQLLSDGHSKIGDPTSFLAEFPQWIQSSRLNNLTGLEVFPNRYISLGVTQALDEWHNWIHESRRRLRIWKGEYSYHRQAQIDWQDWQFLDNEPMSRNDAVLISLPFAGTGTLHVRWDELLVTCDRLGVPIFVDCALYGTCAGISVDLSHPAIKGVAFSTTKGLGCENWRAGLTFSRLRLPHLQEQNEQRLGIQLNVQASLFLMRRHSSDFIYETYMSAQSKVCEHLRLIPTPCVHLATGDQSWQAFSQDGVVNRIGIANAIRDFHRMGRIPDRLRAPGALQPHASYPEM